MVDRINLEKGYDENKQEFYLFLFVFLIAG